MNAPNNPPASRSSSTRLPSASNASARTASGCIARIITPVVAATVAGMRAEDAVRIRVIAGEQPIDLTGIDAGERVGR